jgi:hypothetical protein
MPSKEKARCEFCVSRAKWRFASDNHPSGEYVRYCCGKHVGWLRRLVHFDLGKQLYTFDRVDGRSGS